LHNHHQVVDGFILLFLVSLSTIVAFFQIIPHTTLVILIIPLVNQKTNVNHPFFSSSQKLQKLLSHFHYMRYDRYMMAFSFILLCCLTFLLSHFPFALFPVHIILYPFVCLSAPFVLPYTHPSIHSDSPWDTHLDGHTNIRTDHGPRPSHLRTALTLIHLLLRKNTLRTLFTSTVDL
jgi:hypothetical protein